VVKRFARKGRGLAGSNEIGSCPLTLIPFSIVLAAFTGTMLPAVAYAGTGDAYDNPFLAAATVAQDANVASCKLLEKLKFAPVAQLDKASDCGFKKERFGETAFASHCVELRSFAAKSFQTVENDRETTSHSEHRR
jgi:hypothetical protein